MKKYSAKSGKNFAKSDESNPAKAPGFYLPTQSPVHLKAGQKQDNPPHAKPISETPGEPSRNLFLYLEHFLLPRWIVDYGQTRHTLLQRACDPCDEVAWSEFVYHYRRFIYYILNQVGIDPDDCDDVCQKILLSLTHDLSSYDRSRSKFRSWLSTVIRHAAFSHLRARNRYRIRIEKFGSQFNFEDPGEGPSELDHLIESEWTDYVANIAFERVREVFQGKAIQVFEMGLDEVPPDEIAKRTGLTISSVYTLRKRVKKRLYLEIRALTKELEP